MDLRFIKVFYTTPCFPLSHLHLNPHVISITEKNLKNGHLLPPDVSARRKAGRGYGHGAQRMRHAGSVEAGPRGWAPQEAASPSGRVALPGLGFLQCLRPAVVKHVGLAAAERDQRRICSRLK